LPTYDRDDDRGHQRYGWPEVNTGDYDNYIMMKKSHDKAGRRDEHNGQTDKQKYVTKYVADYLHVIPRSPLT
jgi:hypothetical protein